MHVGKCVRQHVCAYIYVPVHACFLVGGLVCERWEGVMKIVVCVYRVDFFCLFKCSFASNSYKGFDGRFCMTSTMK